MTAACIIPLASLLNTLLPKLLGGELSTNTKPTNSNA